MKNMPFEEAVELILKKETRFDREAYFFLKEALDFSITLFNKPVQGPTRHVSGRELLEGVRQYALKEYGPMALRVLRHWGLERTSDFGEIVFMLVEHGVLGTSERDRREDFAEVYDFVDAFRTPFIARPSKPTPSRRATS